MGAMDDCCLCIGGIEPCRGGGGCEAPVRDAVSATLPLGHADTLPVGHAATAAASAACFFFAAARRNTGSDAALSRACGFSTEFSASALALPAVSPAPVTAPAPAPGAGSATAARGLESRPEPRAAGSWRNLQAGPHEHSPSATHRRHGSWLPHRGTVGRAAALAPTFGGGDVCPPTLGAGPSRSKALGRRGALILIVQYIH